jgi:hypothetical protein
MPLNGDGKQYTGSVPADPSYYDPKAEEKRLEALKAAYGDTSVAPAEPTPQPEQPQQQQQQEDNRFDEPPGWVKSGVQGVDKMLGTNLWGMGEENRKKSEKIQLPETGPAGTVLKEGLRATLGGVEDLVEGVVNLPADIIEGVTGKDLYTARTNLIAENDTTVGAVARTLVRYLVAARHNPIKGAGVVATMGGDFLEDFVATHGDEESLTNQLAQWVAENAPEGLSGPTTTISQLISSIEDNPLGARTMAGIEGALMGSAVRGVANALEPAVKTILDSNPFFRSLKPGGPKIAPEVDGPKAAYPETIQARNEAIKTVDDYANTAAYGGDPEELVRASDHMSMGQAKQITDEIIKNEKDITELQSALEQKEFDIYMYRKAASEAGYDATWDEVALDYPELFTPGNRFVPHMGSPTEFPKLPTEELEFNLSTSKGTPITWYATPEADKNLGRDVYDIVWDVENGSKNVPELAELRTQFKNIAADMEPGTVVRAKPLTDTAEDLQISKAAERRGGNTRARLYQRAGFSEEIDGYQYAVVGEGGKLEPYDFTATPEPTQVKASSTVPHKDLPKLIAENPEGFSVNPYNLESPKSGFMVSIDAEEIELDIPTMRGVGFGEGGAQLSKNRQAITQQLGEWMQRNQKILSRDDTYLGGWIDPETGKLQMEISRNVPDSKTAEELASAFDQKAVFDVDAGEVIDTGGLDILGASKGMSNEWAEMTEALRRRQMSHEALSEKFFKGTLNDFQAKNAAELLSDPKGVSEALSKANFMVPEATTRKMATKMGYEMDELVTVKPRKELGVDQGASVKGTLERDPYPVSQNEFLYHAKSPEAARNYIQGKTNEIFAEIDAFKGIEKLDPRSAEYKAILAKSNLRTLPSIEAYIKGGGDYEAFENGLRLQLGEEIETLQGKGVILRENPKIGSALTLIDNYLTNGRKNFKDLGAVRREAAFNGLSTADQFDRQWQVMKSMMRLKRDAARTWSFIGHKMQAKNAATFTQEVADNIVKSDKSSEALYKAVDEVIEQIRNGKDVTGTMMRQMDQAFNALEAADDIAKATPIFSTLLTALGRGVDALHTRTVLANPKTIAENFVNLTMRTTVEPVMKGVGGIGFGRLDRKMRAMAAAEMMSVQETIMHMNDVMGKIWKMPDTMPLKLSMKPEEFEMVEAVRGEKMAGNLGPVGSMMLSISDYFSRAAQLGILRKPTDWIGKTENIGQYMAANSIATREAAAEVLEGFYEPWTSKSIAKRSAEIMEKKQKLMDSMFDELGAVNKDHPLYKEIKDYGDYFNFRSGKLNNSPFFRALNKVADAPGIKGLTGMIFLKTPAKIFDEAIGATPGINIALRQFDQEWKGLEDLVKQKGVEALTPAQIHKLAYKRGKFRIGYIMMLPAMLAGYFDMGNGAGPMSPDRRRDFFQSNQQRKPYTLGFGEHRISYAWAQPFAQALGMGMELGHLFREMGEPQKRNFNPWTQTAAIAVNSVVKNSVFETTLGMWDNMKALMAAATGDQKFGATGERYLRGMVTRGLLPIPIAVDQAAKIISPEARQTRGLMDDLWGMSGQGLGGLMRKMASGVMPGAAPMKLDTTTGEALTFDGFDKSPFSVGVRMFNFPQPIRLSKQSRTPINKAFEKYGIEPKQPPEHFQGMPLTWEDRNSITKIATSVKLPLYRNRTMEQVLKDYFYSENGPNLRKGGDDETATLMFEQGAAENIKVPQQEFYEKVFKAYYNYAQNNYAANKLANPGTTFAKRMRDHQAKQAEMQKLRNEQQRTSFMTYANGGN